MIDSTDKIGTISYNGVPMEVDKNLTTKTITQNGTYTATDDSADGYSEVTVNVPATIPNVGTKSITENGTYYASSDTLDGYDEVVVNVQGGGGSATLVTKTVTSNGTYAATDDSADGYSTVTVNVPNKFQYYVDAMTGGSEGVFQDNADLTDSDYAYLLDGIVVTAMDFFFSGSSVVNASLFDTSAVTNAQSAFSNSSVETLPLYDFSNVTDASYMFEYCSSLTVIPAYDFSNVTNATGMFDNCSALEEINITGMHVDFDISASVLFTLSALQTIINNLGDVASDGETATLTMSSDSLAWLSQSDIDAANAKGWTITD